MAQEKLSTLARKIKEIKDMLDKFIERQEREVRSNIQGLKKIDANLKASAPSKFQKGVEGIGMAVEILGGIVSSRAASVGKKIQTAVKDDTDTAMIKIMKGDDFIAHVKRENEQQNDIAELRGKLDDLARTLKGVQTDNSKQVRPGLKEDLKNIFGKLPEICLKLNKKTGELGLSNAIIGSWMNGFPSYTSVPPEEIKKIDTFLSKSIKTLKTQSNELKDLQEQVQELEKKYDDNRKSAICAII